MKQLLTNIGIVVSRDIKDRIRKGMITPKTNKDGKTLIQTTHLINSITYLATGNTVRIGTNLKYARIHHEGGTILPFRAKYLAIPLTPEAAVRKPRDFTNTFIAKGCIMRSLEGGKAEALYALKRSVKIPARPYMFVDSTTMASLMGMIRTYAKKEFAKSGVK